jgi:diguanylate cyclase (GGDEF)-like protein
MRLGLTGKFALAVTVGLGLLAALLAGAWRAQRDSHDELARLSMESMRAQGQRALERRGLALASTLADTLTNPVYFVDLKAIGEIAQTALRQPDIEYILVYDARGRVLHDGSRDIERFGTLMRDPLAGRAIDAGGSTVQADDQIVDVAQPIFLGEERLGGVRIGLSRASTLAAVGVAQDALTDAAESMWEQRLQNMGLSVLLFMLLALLSSWLVARTLVRPIRQLAGNARAMEHGRYDVQPASDRHDEIGDLMRAVSHLGQSLASRDRDIRRLAYLDTLTGLPNRLMLREVLSRAILAGHAGGGGLALLFIDLDDFKRINDTLGHDAGDEALAQLAKRFEGCLEAVRDPNVPRADASDLFARFGGDEFVALIGGSDLRERARALAERVLGAVREPLSAAGRPVYLNTSIGITLFPDDAQDAQQLLKNGDIAMYQAKVHGKNCFRFFTNYMTKMAEDRLALEQDLRAAMAGGQLDLHYQPIVDLERERIDGAEALLRWNHPQRGLVPSSLFVAIAEDFGLIDELGRFALMRALHDAAQWPEHGGQPLFVSVNFSMKQLRQPGLPAEVAAALKQAGVAPQRLHVELTESALLDDEPLALSALAELRRMGIKIWLDDFGTGFSGLSHLRRVPVDGVKIDRSFTQDLLTDRDDLALTGAIVAMARSLGIAAVAEGVESTSQLEVLKNLRCDLGQGYWLGYPMSQSELLATLRSERARQRAASAAE